MLIKILKYSSCVAKGGKEQRNEKERKSSKKEKILPFESAQATSPHKKSINFLLFSCPEQNSINTIVT